MQDIIRVLAVDDHPMFRQGIKLTLSEADDIQVVGEADSGHAALRWLRENTCDVVTLDITMQGLDGLSTLKQMRYEKIDTPVIMLSIHPGEQYAIRTLKAGASGYLSKTSVPDELVTAIRHVASGREYITADIQQRMLADMKKDASAEAPHKSLTDREYQILTLIAKGRAVGEIAAELAISVKTVSTHRARILSKMSLQTNAQLMRYALDYHLVD